MKKLVSILIAVAFVLQSIAQTATAAAKPATTATTAPKVIQFSGYILTADSLIGIPFAFITVLNHAQKTMAGLDGYFSFAAEEGDTLVFTCVGFTPNVYVIPKGLTSDKYSIVQPMARSSVYLPTTVIFPWKRENFHEVFMETHPPETDLDRAKKNLDRATLAAVGMKTEPDADEATKQSLRASSANKYYYGQTPPQNIFNPLAWAQFIQAWKNGDFKKQNNTPAPNTEDNSGTTTPQY